MKKFNFVGLPANGSELSRCLFEQFGELHTVNDPKYVLEELLDNGDVITNWEYAERLLAELGTFNCINLVLSYDREQYTGQDIWMNPVSIANQCLYISAVVLLSKTSASDNDLTLAELESELQHYLETLTSDFSNVVFDEYGI